MASWCQHPWDLLSHVSITIHDYITYTFSTELIPCVIYFTPYRTKILSRCIIQTSKCLHLWLLVLSPYDQVFSLESSEYSFLHVILTSLVGLYTLSNYIILICMKILVNKLHLKQLCTGLPLLAGKLEKLDCWEKSPFSDFRLEKLENIIFSAHQAGKAGFLSILDMYFSKLSQTMVENSRPILDILDM